MYKVKSLMWTRYPTSFLVDGKEIRKVKDNTAFPAEKLFAVWSLASLSSEDLYDPFDFYYKPVPDEIIADILPDARYSHKLHTLCATVEPKDIEQVEAFVKHFGFLDYVISPELDRKVNKSKKSSVDFVVLEKLKHLQFSMQVFRAVIYLIALTYKSEEEIDTAEVMDFVPIEVYEALEYDSGFYVGGEKRLSYDDFLDTFEHMEYKTYLWNVVNQHLNARLKRTPGILDTDNDMQTDLYFDCSQKDLRGYSNSDNNLLDALYLMLVLDIIADKRQVKLCNDPLCDNFFVTGKSRAAFCSESCRSRIALIRYRQKKRKQAEKAF